MNKLFGLFLLVFTISFFPASANEFISDADTSSISTPADSSSTTVVRTNRNKLMSVTQQIIQGSYFLPAGEIAYGEGSGLTSSSIFKWDATNKRLNIAPAGSAASNIWSGYTSSLQLGTMSVMEYSSNPQLVIGQNMYFNGTGSVYTANGYASTIGMGDGSGNMSFAVYSNGTAGSSVSGTGVAMTIKNNGNVLIGSTTDQGNYKLQVEGKIKAGSVLAYENANGYSELTHSNSVSSSEYPRAKLLIYGSNSNFNAGVTIANGNAISSAKNAFIQVATKATPTDEGSTSLVLHQLVDGSSIIHNLNREGSTGPGASGPIHIGQQVNSLYGLTVRGDNKILINSTDWGDYKLQVGGAGYFSGGGENFPGSFTSSLKLKGNYPAIHLENNNNEGWLVGRNSANDLSFGYTSGSSFSHRLNLSANGRLKLESPTSSEIKLKSNATGGKEYWLFSTAGDGYGSGDGSFALYNATDNAYRFAVSASGNFGINTYTPQHTLDVNGSARIGSLATGSTTKMVVTDQNGLLSYQDIPSGSGSVSVTSNQVAFGGAGNTITSNSNLTFDGSTFAINTSGIASANYSQYKLAVNGNAIFTRVKVRESAQWPDYVFANNYKLPSLKEVEAFIQHHKHLPEVPSAEEVKKEGLDIGDNQAILLKKIEELTLYAIEQDKTIKKQGHQIEVLTEHGKKLEEQTKSMEELKKEIELLKTLIKSK